jgi:class 3 adenylate cyclase
VNDDVHQLLASLSLERFAPLFDDNEVDLDTLRILSEADLQELGLPFGPRKKVLAALADERHGVPARPADEQRERRYLTVLFSDMVDFTALASSVDPEVLEAVMRVYEDVCIAAIERYAGYVHNRLGDGILAFFGYPSAQERGAERAIRAGNEIIERLAVTPIAQIGPLDRVHARVGVASGVVIVSPADGSATGDTMNLASRLQNVAGIGQIAVSSRVRRLAGDVFDYRDIGAIELKGFPRPVQTYLVEGVRDVASSYDATHVELAPFVGREAELDRLDVAWTEARVRSGRVACLVGEAGIGKSRVVRSVRDRVALDGATPVVVQCSPYHEHSAYFPVVEALRRLLDPLAGDGPGDSLDALERLCAQLGRSHDVALIASVMGLPTDRLDLPVVTPSEHKERSVRAIVGLIEAVAERAPTLLIVEDLHWADPSTLDVLDALIAGIERLPLLVLVTQRPEVSRRWASHPGIVMVELHRFADHEARRLVADLVPAGLPSELVDVIVGRADGIPLFIEELARMVVEHQSDVAGLVTSAADLASVLPHTLRDLLANRLDRLGPAKTVAQLGAVIGRDFSVELLDVVNDHDRTTLEQHLVQLQRSGLAGPTGDGRDGWWTFKHALVRDAAYASIPHTRRTELHGRIAAALIDSRFTPPELIARHLTAAGRPDDALVWWREAGDRARDRFALAESVAHYMAGLELLPQLAPGSDRDRDELRLRSSCAPALVAVRGWASPDVVELLGPAAPLAEAARDRDATLPVLHGLWVHHMSAGEHEVALGWARRQLTLAHEIGDEVLELNGHRGLMTSNFWLGNLTDSLEHGDRIRERYDPVRHASIAEVTNADPYTADGSYRCQSLWILGYPDLAREVSDEKDEFARRRNHPFDLCFALTIGAFVYEYRGEPEALLERTEEATRIGREHRVPLMSEMMAQIITGIGWLRMGRVGASIDQIRTSLTALRATGHRAWVPYVHAVLGEAMAADGDLAAGRDEIDRAIELMRLQGELVHLPEALRLQGWVSWQEGDLAAAEMSLDRSIRLAVLQGARSWQLRSTTTLAELRADAGDTSVATDVLRPLLETFTEGAGTADHRRAEHVLRRATASASG